MNLLAIETCLGKCSVSLSRGNNILSYLIEEEPHKQSERLILMIEEALLSVGFSYASIDALAVNIGPGSFTGIRIGAAAINGIATCLKKPIIEVTSLEAIALGEKTDENICSLIDAGRGQAYAQNFLGVNPLSMPLCINYDDILEFSKGFSIVSNKIYGVLGSDCAIRITEPNARLVAMVAFSKFEMMGSDCFSERAMPFYIRESDAKIVPK